MNRQTMLLMVLMEECAEVQKNASKCARFGPDSYHPDDPYKVPNSRKIQDELNDLMAVVMMLVDEGVIEPGWMDTDAVRAKKEKVQKFMNISKRLGCLAE